MTKFVKIGKLTIALQALLAFVSGVFVSLAILAVGGFSSTAVVTSLVGLISCTYAAYVINCTIVGKCTVLAWVLAVFNIVYGALVLPIAFTQGKVGSALSSSSSKKK